MSRRKSRARRRSRSPRNARHRGVREEAVAARAIEFPQGFEWGAATAAYQIEGGRATRGDTIWDTFCKGKRDNGDDACGHRALWRQDVQRMRDMSLPHYRLSLSWARIWPDGTQASEGDGDGVHFYLELLRRLRADGILPCVTLYHWDLPQALQDRGGWLSRESPMWFAAFARRCFALFDDLVHRWITINEPWCVSVLGHASGAHAPGDTSRPNVHPYVVAHHLILAHAFVYRLYKREGGRRPMGITLNAEWPQPVDKRAERAAARHLEFTLGWFAEPIFGANGDYPEVMRRVLGRRLPAFSPVMKKMVRRTSDFFGINWYTSRMCSSNTILRTAAALPSLVKMASAEAGGVWGALANARVDSYFADVGTVISHRASWPLTHMGWPVAPFGFVRMLKYIENHYPTRGGIVVTENGVAVEHEKERDGGRKRISFLRYHLLALRQAMLDGVDVRGYYLWSLLDNFEWQHGYEKRFGAFHVDYLTHERIAKPVVGYYKRIMETNLVDDDVAFRQTCETNLDFRVPHW